MPKIFQKFDLDLEEISKLSDEERTGLNLVQAGKTLKQKLKEKGYQVLESNTNHCGIPENIILGGEFNLMRHKQDFYKITNELGLNFFKSGEFYM